MTKIIKNFLPVKQTRDLFVISNHIFKISVRMKYNHFGFYDYFEFYFRFPKSYCTNGSSFIAVHHATGDKK